MLQDDVTSSSIRNVSYWKQCIDRGVAETVADVTNLLTSAATKAAKLKLLKTQIQHKRSSFPDFAAQNKQPFVFSREK